MGLTKFVASQVTAAAVALITASVSGSARADVMTSTWTGTVSYINNATNVNYGDTLTLTVTYDTSALGPVNTFSNFNQWSNSFGNGAGENGFYSSVTYSVGAFSGSFSALNTDTGSPYSYSVLTSGAGTDNIYDNYLYDSAASTYIEAYFNNYVDFVTTGDPTQTFSYNPPYGTGLVTLDVGSSSLQANVTNVTVTDATETGVPTPGAIALLGLGLIGIGARRRKAGRAQP